MHVEIEFFCDNLEPESGIEWETAIAHLIPRTPFATTIGDSSLEGAGGFSIALGFWWHIRFLDKIIQRTKEMNWIAMGHSIHIELIETLTCLGMVRQPSLGCVPLMVR